MEREELRLTKNELVNKDQNEGSSALTREWQALALGFADGMERAGSHTLADLKQGAKDLSEHPLSTSASYLANHWSDAAVGAAITLLNPKKLANALLIGYSLRGAGYASYDTFVGALDPKSNVSELRNQYANQIAQQGTAFICTMPLAMAGGMAGRAGANAVFGKNMGALDLVTGKVSLDELKSNLWDIHDRINPPTVKLVITDMDNTLAPHGRYFANGVKNAISELADKTKIPESELYKSIGHEMEVHRSHDYPWSLELALKDRVQLGKPGGMSYETFEKDIAAPFWKTIDHSLEELYKPYPTVTSTLAELKKQNIPVVVLSDAPAYMGLKRLVNLGFEKGTVERFYGLHNWIEPEGLKGKILEGGNQRVESALKTEHGLKEFRALPMQWEKPDVHGFNALMRHYGVRPSQTLMIGDSISKDVGVAHTAGARALWAKYGHPVKADEAILTRLRPLPEHGGGVETPAVKKPAPPYLEAVDSYDRLLAHLNPARPQYSELASQASKSLLVRPEISPIIGAFAWTEPTDLKTANQRH